MNGNRAAFKTSGFFWIQVQQKHHLFSQTTQSLISLLRIRQFYMDINSENRNTEQIQNASSRATLKREDRGSTHYKQEV